MLGIRHRDFRRERARGGIRRDSNCFYLAFEASSIQRWDGHNGASSFPYLGDLGFGNADPHLHGIEIENRKHRVSDLDGVTHIDFLHADETADRRAKLAIAQTLSGLAEVRFCRVLPGN